MYTEDVDEAFYFNAIMKDTQKVTHLDVEKVQTRITFRYSHSNKRSLEASVLFEGIVPDELDHLVFCIGMCILPWYWMGFGCRRIVIEKDVYNKRADGVLEFWQYLYSNVLLEYIYSNAGAEAPVIEMQSSGNDSEYPQPISRRSADTLPVLVPIGCKCRPALYSANVYTNLAYRWQGQSCGVEIIRWFREGRASVLRFGRRGGAEEKLAITRYWGARGCTGNTTI